MPSRTSIKSVQEFGTWLAVEFPDMSFNDFNTILTKADEIFGWEPMQTHETQKAEVV